MVLDLCYQKKTTFPSLAVIDSVKTAKAISSPGLCKQSLCLCFDDTAVSAGNINPNFSLNPLSLLHIVNEIDDWVVTKYPAPQSSCVYPREVYLKTGSRQSKVFNLKCQKCNRNS